MLVCECWAFNKYEISSICHVWQIVFDLASIVLNVLYQLIIYESQSFSAVD